MRTKAEDALYRGRAVVNSMLAAGQATPQQFDQAFAALADASAALKEQTSNTSTVRKGGTGMNLKEKRAAALKAAQDIIAKAKAENRDLTADEVTEIERRGEEIRDLDVHIENARKGNALIDSIGRIEGGGPRSGHLQLAGLAKSMTAGMVAYATRLGRVKGLTPSGETVTPVPVVNSLPFASTAGERPPRLADVLDAVVRPSPTYRILRQVNVADPGAAGVVAVGGTKPTFKLGFEAEDARLRVLAVLSEPIDKFLLEDATNLNTWVGQQLADQVEGAIEGEIVSGDGTGEHMTGLLNVSGAQVQAWAVDQLTTVLHGLSLLEQFSIAPQFVALAPADWLTIAGTRNSGGNFDANASGPVDPATRRLWGAPVVVVPSLAAGTGLIVGEQSVTVSTDGAGLRTDWDSSTGFSTNELRARVEGRFNLDILRAHGLVKLSLTEPSEG